MKKWRIIKLCRMMKMLILMMSIGLTHLSANVKSQQIDLTLKNVTIEQAVNEAERLLNQKFFFSKNEVDVNRKINVNLSKANLKELVHQVFGISFSYLIEGNIIVVRPNKTLDEQKKEIMKIKGTVTDKQKLSLPGVTVMIKGSKQGTATDVKGQFTLEFPKQDTMVLVFSFIGMKKKEVRIVDSKPLIVVLEEDVKEVDEVVVTGYQKIEKRKLTSSIANVKMDEINRVGVASVDAMLAGQIAGVFSTPTTGAPSAGSKVKIRSTVTINGNTDPLWVLDGMPLEGNDLPTEWSSKENIDNLYNMSIAGLNPDDIQDITVLKDAAATAIYGARAANGVIIITTKRGSRNQPTRVNFSAAAFITDRPNLAKLNLMNATQKVDFELQLVENRQTYLKEMGGVARVLAKYDERKKLIPMDANDQRTLAERFATLSPEAQNEINALRVDGTDWAKEIYRVALNQQYSINLSGGGEHVSYYASGGYYKEEGTTRGSGFERLNLTLKTDFNLFENLRFGASLFVGQNKSTSYVTDTDVFINPSRYTRNVNPYVQAYDENGEYAYDPDMTYTQRSDQVLDFSYAEEMDNTSYELKVRSIKPLFDLEYTPFNGLKLYTQFGIQVDNTNTEKIAQEQSYFTRKYALDSKIWVNGVQKVYLPEGGIIHNWNHELTQYNWKAQAEYAGTFAEKHEIGLMVGLEMRASTNTDVHSKGFGYDHKTLTTKPMITPDGDAGTRLTSNPKFNPYKKSFNEDRYLSYFFTASYTYDNRYTIFGSMRYDGTNLFGVDPKYKFNPMWSISGAWNVNREAFLREASWLDNLRFRGSYGVQGNIDRSTSPYILGTWNTASIGGLNEDRITVSSPPNPSLRWETTYSWNAALDLAVLSNRVNMIFEMYGRKSKDLISLRVLPLENGFQTSSANFGEISSKGVEFTLNTVNILTKNFRWNTSINLAHNSDKVDKYFINDNSWTPSLEGYSRSAVFGFKTAGLDESGRPMFWKDGEKVTMDIFTQPKQTTITAAEVRDMQSYLGSTDPKITGGFNNKFTYGDFDLTISCNFVLGQLVVRQPFYDPIRVSPGVNYTTEMDKVWSKTNPEGIYPVIGSAMMQNVLEKFPINMWNALDIWNETLNYLRVNSIRLGYSLPKSVATKLNLSGVRFSFEARNPFVISTSHEGYFDPETYGNIYSQPIARSYSLGINVSF